MFVLVVLQSEGINLNFKPTKTHFDLKCSTEASKLPISLEF